MGRSLHALAEGLANEEPALPSGPIQRLAADFRHGRHMGGSAMRHWDGVNICRRQVS